MWFAEETEPYKLYCGKNVKAMYVGDSIPDATKNFATDPLKNIYRLVLLYMNNYFQSKF